MVNKYHRELERWVESESHKFTGRKGIAYEFYTNKMKKVLTMIRGIKEENDSLKEKVSMLEREKKELEEVVVRVTKDG